MNLSTKLSILLTLFAAVFYQGYVKSTLFITLGVGRTVQPISDFPNYSCRRIHDKRLQACEDMWLDESGRRLFLACSESLPGRREWMPNIGRFNASGRSLTDAIIVLEIDKPTGDDGSFEYTVLSTPDFPGINNDGTLNLVGFTARNLLPAASEEGGGTEIYLVNARPSLDPLTGQILNKPNMTLESFLLPANSTELKHLATWHHPLIQTPNNIALDPSYGLFFTNDHGSATHGISHTLAPFTGNGDVTYCGSPTSCRTVVSNLKFPNGLLLDPKEQRIYVPSAWIGNILIYSYGVDRRLTLVSEIEIDMPIDNLSQDSLGEIWVAGMPQARETLRAFQDPMGVVASSTIMRVKRGLEGWVVEKVLEDKEGEVLPGTTTTVVRDVRGKRLFMSGVTSPFIGVCEEVRGG